MASFNYNLQKPFVNNGNGERKINPDETRVYLTIIESRGDRARIKTEFKISPKLWDFKKQRMKHQAVNSVTTNDRLEKLIIDVRDEYNKIKDKYSGMSFSETTRNIKGFVENKISPVFVKDNFFKAFDKYIEAREKELNELTIKKFKTLRTSLVTFDPDISFDKIDRHFFDSYVNYLRELPAKHSRQKNRPEDMQIGLLSDTLQKYIGDLKTFLRWSHEYGYHNNMSYTYAWFKINKDDKIGKLDIVTLRMNELRKLYKHDFSNRARLERMRDVFCFLAFTGQRWSDVVRFDKKQIIDKTLNGQYIKAWQFHSYKTGKKVFIPFLGFFKPAYDILEKYNFKLPTISEQNFNKYIKEVGLAAGLDREITMQRKIARNRPVTIIRPLHKFMSSHMGRRTCVSLLLNVERMKINEVMQITQHSDLQTLYRYMDEDIEALTASISQTNAITTPMHIIKNNAI